jgi:hypothetical protein
MCERQRLSEMILVMSLSDKIYLGYLMVLRRLLIIVIKGRIKLNYILSFFKI